MPPNDPQWGRRKNEGPPDLDEVWNRLNQKLSSLFRGRKGPPPPGSDFKQYRGGFGFIILLVIALWAVSGFYIVDAGERGVVLRFGQYSETTDPGLHWHLPYPIESREIVDIARVRTVEVGYRNNVKSKVPKESLMLTDDGNIVDLQFAVQYTIRDAEDFLFNNRNPEDSVLQAVETAMREIVGKSGMDFVLYEGRTEIAANATKLMQGILDRYETGINVSVVTMQNAQPPEQVQAAFDDAVKAGQDRERKINEGQTYANEIIENARGDASRLLQEAQGYRSRVTESAQGEASRFNQILSEYAKAPEVTRERLYLEAMQQVLSNTSTVLIDQKGGGGNLLYLPLDKIIQGTAERSAGQTAKNTAPEAATPETSARSRDALRSREREQR
ncbi:MAG: FtsH protease activity modulator HflK [Burkholderiales bacterium]